MAETSFKIIGFDLDGTLVDSRDDIIDAVLRVLEDLGRPPLSRDMVGSFIGRGAGALLRDALAATGAMSEATLSEAMAQFTAHYGAQLSAHTRPYPDVDAMLHSLQEQGYVLAICTNKPHALADQLLIDLGLRHFFVALIGGDSLPDGRRKPDPAPLRAMIAAAGGGATLFVGDSIHDVDAAQAAGVPVVAVRHGYRDRPVEALGADAILDGFDQLPAMIAGWPS